MQFLNAFGSSALADLPRVCTFLPPMYDMLFMFLHSMMGTWTIPQSLAITDEVATIRRLFVLHDGNITVEIFSQITPTLKNCHDYQHLTRLHLFHHWALSLPVTCGMGPDDMFFFLTSPWGKHLLK